LLEVAVVVMLLMVVLQQEREGLEAIDLILLYQFQQVQEHIQLQLVEGVMEALLVTLL
jgi:hypothetical protein